jgi:hypothetical protein
MVLSRGDRVPQISTCFAVVASPIARTLLMIAAPSVPIHCAIILPSILSCILSQFRSANFHNYILTLLCKFFPFACSELRLFS